MTVTEAYSKLNNGIEMPLLGLGVYDMYGKEAEAAISRALEIGYRLIDTAAMYRNETETGRAIRNSALPREQIFVTTKVNNSNQGYDDTLKAFDASRKKMGLDYVDLYMIHWPLRNTRESTWKALEHLYQTKQTRAIGVANYLQPFLKELETYSEIVPAVNQVEFSPYLYLEDLLNECKRKQIQLQSYSPLIRGRKFKDPRLLKLASKYGKTPAQIILRWNIELKVSAIPKSVSPERLQENFDIWDFQLSREDRLELNSFHENLRVVEDPMDFF